MITRNVLGWQCSILPQVADRDDLFIWRPAGPDHIEVLTLDGSELVVERRTHDETQYAQDLDGVIQFPRGVLEAIIEAVRPGPSSDVTGELRASLDKERERVDKVLAWATTQMIPR